MLKWAVNGPRQTYLPTVAENTTTTTNNRNHDQDYTIRRRSSTTTPTAAGSTTTADVPSSSSRHRRCSLPSSANSTATVRKVCRKLSDNSSLRRKLLVGNRQDNKENHLTSTPLPLSMRNASPLRKLGSLKDLSNITPDKFVSSPSSVSVVQTPKRMKIETPPKPQYASTLPTFGVEYSPCELVPGPILALRGIGIADNYFEKPRYLTHEFKDLNQKAEKRAKMSTSGPPSAPAEEDSTLSSSKMGDLTLERMIDAILESARKDRKIPKAKQTNHQHFVMSPTYTAADDPASDLHEFWDPQSEKYQQELDPPPRHPSYPNAAFNEREVRTPEAFDKHAPAPPAPLDFQDAVASCQLRRQRAVRRKRKLTELKSSVKNSAQKLLKRKSFGDRLDTPKKKGTIKALRNISPDSGRNSSSDLEDSTLDAGNYTKRRLSFSPNDLKDN